MQKPELTCADSVKNIDFNSAFVIADRASHDFLKNISVCSVVYNDLNKDLGRYLNLIVCERLQNTDLKDYLWGKLKPLYLQAPPISMSTKIKSK